MARDLPDFDVPEAPRPKAPVVAPVVPEWDDIAVPTPASTRPTPKPDPTVDSFNLLINNPADFEPEPEPLPAAAPAPTPAPVLAPAAAETLPPAAKEAVAPARIAPVDFLRNPADAAIPDAPAADVSAAPGEPDFAALAARQGRAEKMKRMALMSVPVAVVVGVALFSYQHRFEIGNSLAGLFGTVKPPEAVAAPEPVRQVVPAPVAKVAPAPKPAPIVEAAPVIEQPAPAPVAKVPEPAAPAIDRPFVSPAPSPAAVEPVPVPVPVAPAPKVVAKAAPAPAPKKPAPQRVERHDAETERLEAIARALDAKINER